MCAARIVIVEPQIYHGHQCHHRFEVRNSGFGCSKAKSTSQYFVYSLSDKLVCGSHMIIDHKRTVNTSMMVGFGFIPELMAFAPTHWTINQWHKLIAGDKPNRLNDGNSFELGRPRWRYRNDSNHLLTTVCECNKIKCRPSAHCDMLSKQSVRDERK